MNGLSTGAGAPLVALTRPKPAMMAMTAPTMLAMMGPGPMCILQLLDLGATVARIRLMSQFSG